MQRGWGSTVAGGNRATRRRVDAASELAAALVHHRAGRLDRAGASYRKILKKWPENPDALHLLGMVALDEGRAERAAQLIGRAVALAPQTAEMHANLGNALRTLARSGEACASFRRAIALQPDYAPAHNNLGLLLHATGDFAGALASYRRAAELLPNLAEIHSNLAGTLRALGRLEEAEAALRRALALDPGNVAHLANLGNVLVDLGQYDKAEACYRSAIALDPRFAPAHYGLAACRRLSGEMAEAVEIYRKALSLSQEEPVMWNDLGTALRALGHFEEAVDAFNQAMALKPDFADAYRNLANCRSLAVDQQEMSRLSALAERPDLPLEERAAVGFAMAKTLDDAGRYDEAFAALHKANRRYRLSRAAAGEAFDIAALRTQINKAIDTYTPAYFASVTARGTPSELPVFIVGMPRSGTSLVEQIAASHSKVFGAGELRDIGRLVAQLGSSPSAATVHRLATTHCERLRTRGGDADRVIDKLPDNVLALGEIATMFPAARIIFCRRDPRDICLSCYFQKFSPGQLMFSYDLADCARRHLEIERLSVHWRRVLPLRMLEVDYEALVADLEGESRRLVTFLGLNWEPACLEFYRTERTVATASGWQVRQPLYDRSVGRWRNYRRHLAPLLEILDEAEKLHGEAR